MRENKANPQDSGYNDIYTILFDETDIATTISNFKNTIDFLYSEYSQIYLVVYIETCPNGLDICDKPCWAVYFLQ